MLCAVKIAFRLARCKVSFYFMHVGFTMYFKIYLYLYMYTSKDYTRVVYSATAESV